MKKVTVIYHEEKRTWWAESPDAESFFATGETLDQVRSRVYESLPGVVDSPIDVFTDVVIQAAGPSLTAPDTHEGLWRFDGLLLPGMLTAETR
jgi:predicted RNase H-like HicB family nuclease